MVALLVWILLRPEEWRRPGVWPRPQDVDRAALQQLEETVHFIRKAFVKDVPDWFGRGSRYESSCCPPFPILYENWICLYFEVTPMRSAPQPLH